MERMLQGVETVRSSPPVMGRVELEPFHRIGFGQHIGSHAARSVLIEYTWPVRVQIWLQGGK